MAKPNNVVIVGAGIAGLSTAFHLADKGAKGVTLIDKGRVGSGSSSRSGAVNTMMMATERATRARGVSFDIFERFDRILDDYEFHQVGCMAIYDAEQMGTAAQLFDMQRQAGARFEVLDGAEIESRFPDLRVREGDGGVLDLRGGWNEPDRYIPALTAKIREMGVAIREDCPVEEFLVDDGRVAGVRLRGGEELRTDATVCTVNAWANSLLSRVGQPLPARNFVHERFVTKPFDHPPRLPAVNCNAASTYFRPTESNGLLLGASNMECVQVVPDVDFDLSELTPTPNSLELILGAVGDYIPLMQNATIDYHRVGLVSYPIDFMPNIGPVAALPGLFLGTNFCSGGFGHHPMAGKLIAEYIVDGQTSYDGADFDPDRFADFDTEEFLNRDVSHSEMVDAHAATGKVVIRKH